MYLIEVLGLVDYKRGVEKPVEYLFSIMPIVGSKIMVGGETRACYVVTQIWLIAVPPSHPSACPDAREVWDPAAMISGPGMALALSSVSGGGQFQNQGNRARPVPVARISVAPSI